MDMYDVILVGSGTANLFAAMELTAKKKKVLILEKARRLNDSRYVSMGWFGGLANAPLNVFIDPGFGGDITDKRTINYFVDKLSKYTELDLKESKPKILKKTTAKLEAGGITLREPTTIPLSEERMSRLGAFFYKHLKAEATVIHKISIWSIHYVDGHYELETNDGIFKGLELMLGVGRSGQQWLTEIDHNLELEAHGETYDLGLRIEAPIKTMQEIFSKTPYFQLKWENYKTTVPTIQGLVEAEDQGILRVANGRGSRHIRNYLMNFGILKTFNSKTPAKDLYRLAEMTNVLSDGDILKEPLSKFLTGGSMLRPIAELDELRLGLEKLVAFFPELRYTAQCYFPECRVNTGKFKLSSAFEAQAGLYVVGDMSGRTKSFTQAACSGILAAKNILRRKK